MLRFFIAFTSENMCHELIRTSMTNSYVIIQISYKKIILVSIVMNIFNQRRKWKNTKSLKIHPRLVIFFVSTNTCCKNKSFNERAKYQLTIKWIIITLCLV